MRTVTSASRMDASTRQTEIDDRPLLHEVTGRGEPVVLVPGTLTGWASWKAHAERLAAGHMVVRVQVRNVELVEAGAPIPGGYGIITEREGLRATVDALGLDRVDLVGWSHGGITSLAFALAYPERVRTLTLIEPPAMWLLRATGYDPATLATGEAADRALAGKEITIDDLEAFLIRAGIGNGETDFEAHPRWPLMVRNRQAISTVFAEWDHTDSLERLRSLQVPILAIKGTDTSDVAAACVDALAVTAPRVTVLELPGGHACHIEHIDRFLEELEAFLERE